MKFAFFLCFIFLSCARAPLTDPEKAFLPPVDPPELRDSYSIESLRDAFAKTLAAYSSSNGFPAEFHFANRVVTRNEYRQALLALEPELATFERFHEFLRANFDFLPVYGDEKPGQIFATGYYDVSLTGSRLPKGKWTEPLYRAPSDMVSVDLRAFAERMPDVKPLQDLVLEQRAKIPTWRGRLVKEGNLTRVVPYFQRSEIQRQRALKGRGLELVYVDPVDAFFLEIQGSGEVELENGSRIRVGYDTQNGAPYTPIGKFLWNVIPKEQMSMQRIREHLSGLSREQQQDLFDKNASFVFFKELKGEAVSYSGAEVTAMRTLATDQILFPKGTLGFLEIELPVFANEETQEPSGWEPKPRWVFDQDTGGAIRGGGRVDLYMGRGAEAARTAGVMKRKGQLWIVAPKAEFLARIRISAPVVR